MDSSQLTRHKRDRYSANALNGATPRPIFPIDDEKRVSYKQGSKIVTYNKRTIMPGCTGPTCNEDIVISGSSSNIPVPVPVEPTITTIYTPPTELGEPSQFKVSDVIVDSDNVIYVIESTYSSTGGTITSRLKKLNPAYTIYSFTGPSFDVRHKISRLALDNDDKLYFYKYNNALTFNVLNIYDKTNDSITESGSSSGFDSFIYATVIDKNTGNLYFADTTLRIFKSNTSGDAPILLAGGGNTLTENYRNDTNGANALFNVVISGLAFDGTNNCLYVADYLNNCIRKVSLVPPYAVTSFVFEQSTENPPTSGPVAQQNVKPANYDEFRTNVQFSSTPDVEIDANGNLYVADQIQQIDFVNTTTNYVTLFAGGLSATSNPLFNFTFAGVQGLFSKSPTQLYVADDTNGVLLISF